MIISLQYIFAGLVGGLIVASWHGYKDTPWEGWVQKRFPRSIIIGAFLGLVFFSAKKINLIQENNLGVIILSIVCLERLIGEVLKGFIKRKNHAEYLPLFRSLNLPFKRYSFKLLAGIFFFIVASLILYSFTQFQYVLQNYIGNKLLLGAILGFFAGLIVAFGGAIKDSPAEGFLPSKFIRSPFVGFIGGILLVFFTSHLDLIIIATIGFERIVVEFYKTFFNSSSPTKPSRGIFRGIKPKYLEWFQKRWIFFATYFFAVLTTFIFLIFT